MITLSRRLLILVAALFSTYHLVLAAYSLFVPPDPPLVLGRDPLLTMAWALVVGAPILLLVVLVVVRPYPVIVAQVGGGAFLAGLAILLWRMPHRREDDDEGPGAVV